VDEIARSYPNAPEIRSVAERILTRRREAEERERAAYHIALIEQCIRNREWPRAAGMIAAAERELPSEPRFAPLLEQVRQAQQEERRRFIQERQARLAPLEADGRWDEALALVDEIARRYPDAPEIAGVSVRLQNARRKAEERRWLAQQVELIEASLQDAAW
jgi:hypothetical protein